MRVNYLLFNAQQNICLWLDIQIIKWIFDEQLSTVPYEGDDQYVKCVFVVFR